MDQATLNSVEHTQIANIACKCVQQLGCFDAQVTTIGAPVERAYRVTMVGTISGQRLEMQALVVRLRQNKYACDNWWISRHA